MKERGREMGVNRKQRNGATNPRTVESVATAKRHHVSDAFFESLEEQSAYDNYLEHHDLEDKFYSIAEFYWDEQAQQQDHILGEVGNRVYDEKGSAIARGLEEDYIAELMTAGATSEQALKTAQEVDFIEVIVNGEEEFLAALRQVAEDSGRNYFDTQEDLDEFLREGGE